MHNLPLYQVDTFTPTLFGGNPAAVVPVPEFPRDELMQYIATENNLSETAFVVIRGRGKFDIRWFTPAQEVRLCGHATLAAAHVLFSSAGEGLEKMTFRTRKAGNIVVKAREDGRYDMAFRADAHEKIRAPKNLRGALGGLKPVAVYRGTDDIVAVVKNQKQVASCTPNLHVIKSFKSRGLIVTAPGKEVDFVSRCFYPAWGIDEDPVTGSAHTLLTPIWAERLKQKKLTASQLSARGGAIDCRLRGKKVTLTGAAITFLAGQILLDRL